MVAVAKPTRITYIFGLHGPTSIEDLAEMSLWVDTGDPMGFTDIEAALVDIAGKAYQAWATNVNNNLWRTSVTLQTVKVARLGSTFHTEHEQEYSPGTKWAGTGTSESLPWQTSFCVGLYSYTPGTFIADARSRRGRVFLPPFCANTLDIVTKGTLADSSVSSLLNDMKAWINAVNAIVPDTVAGSAHLTVGVVSRVFNKAPRVPAEIYALTDLAADGVIDTQRRRTHQELRTRTSVGL